MNNKNNELDFSNDIRAKQGLWDNIHAKKDDKKGDKKEEKLTDKEKKLPELDINDNLFHAMDLLSKHSAVLINENNSFSKLITTRVVADALRDYSLKFLSIESLENKLRDIVRALKILHPDWIHQCFW